MSLKDRIAEFNAKRNRPPEIMAIVQRGDPYVKDSGASRLHTGGQAPGLPLPNPRGGAPGGGWGSFRARRPMSSIRTASSGPGRPTPITPYAWSRRRSWRRYGRSGTAGEESGRIRKSLRKTGRTLMETYYDPADLAKFGDIGKDAPELAKKYFDYYADVFKEGGLAERERALIAPGGGPGVPCDHRISPLHPR